MALRQSSDFSVQVFLKHKSKIASDRGAFFLIRFRFKTSLSNSSDVMWEGASVDVNLDS